MPRPIASVLGNGRHHDGHSMDSRRSVGMAGFVGFYTFGAGHTDKHYLMNPAARKYSTAVSRQAADGKRYDTCEAALAAVEKWLAREPGGQYAMLAFAEEVA